MASNTEPESAPERRTAADAGTPANQESPAGRRTGAGHETALESGTPPLPGALRAVRILRFAALAVVAALVFYLAFSRGELEAPRDGGGSGPPVLRRVPEFRLIDQDGRERSLADLKGKVWVATFIFTHCTQACPLMAARLRELQDRIRAAPHLGEHVRLVSFSVDPERDTPERLKAFGALYGRDPDIWLLLTGKEGEVVALSTAGFGLGAGGRPPEGDSGPGIIHSDRFVLVDREGRIRGYYRPTAGPEEFERLIADLDLLVSGGRTAGAP